MHIDYVYLYDYSYVWIMLETNRNISLGGPIPVFLVVSCTFHSRQNFPPSYLRLDTEGRVLRFDSFSKILAAGLRVGWVTGPQPLIRKICLHKGASVISSASMSQVAIVLVRQIVKQDVHVDVLMLRNYSIDILCVQVGSYIYEEHDVFFSILR